MEEAEFAIVNPADLLRQSDYQQLLAGIPENYWVIAAGGRGSGKTVGTVQLMVRHATKYPGSRQVLIRRTYKSMRDVITVLRTLAIALGGGFNGQEMLARFANGSTIELAQVLAPADLQKLQGKSFSQIVVDEAQFFPEIRVLDSLHALLRGPVGVPTRLIYCCNPGGQAHAQLGKRFIFRARSWVPTTDDDTGKVFVVAPGTFRDNPFLDQAAYEASLRASAAGDDAKLRMWLDGDWSAFQGAIFEGCFDAARNVIDPWTALPTVASYAGSMGAERRAWLLEKSRWRISWKYHLALDHGSTSPAACLLLGTSPGDMIAGIEFPKGSVVVVDEVVTNRPGSLTKGQNLTVPQTAVKILRMCARWNVDPWGVADPSCFAKHGHEGGSLADEYKAAGVQLDAAPRADRVSGWEHMRRMLFDAGTKDAPGLWIARNCEYLLETLPFAPRDEDNPDDIDTESPDHALDALSYGLRFEHNTLDPLTPLIRWPY